MNLKELLKNHYVLTDGAMGTYYNLKYPAANQAAELANITRPREIIDIHKEYLMAGARILRTNSFASNVQVLCGKPLRTFTNWDEPLKQVHDNVCAAFQNAKSAAAECHVEAWIAGDIGPVPEQGASDDEELTAQYETMADALIASGAEMILFETFADFRHILPTIKYIKAQANPVIMTSFCLNKFGYTKTGLSAAGILKTAANSGLIDIVGFNCGIGSAHMENILKHVDLGDMLVSVVPNSGYPDLISDRQMYQEKYCRSWCQYFRWLLRHNAGIYPHDGQHDL